MPRKSEKQFTERELRRLLKDLDQLAAVEPLSDEEVIAIEAQLQYETITPERDARLRAQFEQLRQEWITNTETLDSLFDQAKTVGLSRPDFAQRMRIDHSTLLKLERRMLTDIPHRAITQIANTLHASFRAVYLYLAQPPKDLTQMAASSKGQPTVNPQESWAEAIVSSKMTEEDKAYWLDGTK